MPTAMISMATLPCPIGLRTSRPMRLFGFNGLTDEAPLSPAACNDLAACGLSSVTAPSILAYERTFDLQGVFGRDKDASSGADCIRATFSRKGRRKTKTGIYL